MRDEDNNNNIGASTPSSVQRAVPFGDGGNDSNINNEVVDNNYNNDDNIPTTVSENNDISVDEEVGSNVNRYEQYHPDDISRQRVRTIYDATCGDLFSRELDIGRPTIAYSRPPNIGDKITQAKLHQAPGKPASYYLGEYIHGQMGIY